MVILCSPIWLDGMSTLRRGEGKERNSGGREGKVKESFFFFLFYVLKKRGKKEK